MGKRREKTKYGEMSDPSFCTRKSWAQLVQQHRMSLEHHLIERDFLGFGDGFDGGGQDGIPREKTFWKCGRYFLVAG